MATWRPEAQALLSRLLEKYEASVAVFEQPGPWPRDRILKFEPTAFPEEFAPTGAEQRRALVESAAALAEAKALRIVWHAGYARGEPKEFRLGPAEVDAAYAMARAWDFRPLRTAFDEVAAACACARVGSRAPAPWMTDYLAMIEKQMAAAEPAPVFVSRKRLKLETRDVIDTIRAAAAISAGVSGWERLVSEQLFGDSKRLATIRGSIARLLVEADPDADAEGDISPLGPDAILARYGIRRLPPDLRVAGGAVVHYGRSIVALRDADPSLALPGTWAEALGMAIVRGGATVVTTIENEYSFQAYVEQAGGPGGLADRGEAVLFTAGRPAPPLVRALRTASAERPDLRVRHWGDPDVGGLEIWWYLRRELARRVELHRTTAEWVRSVLAERAGIPLSMRERIALVRLRAQWDGAEGTDVQDARELADVLLVTGMKVEQERYRDL